MIAIQSNKLSDVKTHYFAFLSKKYNENESRSLLYLLIEYYTGINKSKLLAEDNLRISESEIVAIHKACKDLMNNRPIQYIIGETEFYKLRILVNENVLIPRPETEELVHNIIEKNKYKSNLHILDICTGSACIAISLAKNLDCDKISAIDISKKALEIAAKNAELNKAKINFLQKNILKKSPEGKWDIIVSNPPYVKQSEKKAMEKNVLDYEPELALFVNDEDPFIFYESIAEYAYCHLSKKGELWLEINEAHADEIKDILNKKGFANLVIIKDLFGKDRMLFATTKF